MATTTEASQADGLQTLADHFKDRPLSEHGSRWNTCWQRNQTDWDRGQHSVALLEILTQGLPPQNDDEGQGRTAGELFPGHPCCSSGSSTTITTDSGDQYRHGRRRPKALVPGCGRGYDVLLLGSLGYDVVGLDLSPIGIQRAREHAERSQKDGTYPVKLAGGVVQHASPEPGSFQFVEGDFFKDDWLEQVSGGGGGGEKDVKFDLIFDYTFGCALPPSARPQWANRLSSLLLRPGGRLVCLEFPSTKSPDEPGPPWAMPPGVYERYLGGRNSSSSSSSSNIQGSRVGRGGGEEEEESAGGAGLKRLIHGKPTKTHAAGMREEDDGKGGKTMVVVDCVSVWSH
ncbi:S-adenosyl-L-methionine-dependent methyltransferase [Microdochium trichocladiopsis]|uniref:S-adenosyl-L-methionine-dependent methyltransferase n=1 Tax=Microdochium trichocladiopsis TaxID=1682393 RepID=A0A9P9BM33_9PEZI|nr:S-adenosyl-L-methionine-dependent methyltransferase [Microdochium trichocladiopsis]KAH7025870.1 S-adenosyl-L-methionine-dependent methyltransferase [Microdochium trichocladiopsis]